MFAEIASYRLREFGRKWRMCLNHSANPDSQPHRALRRLGPSKAVDSPPPLSQRSSWELARTSRVLLACGTALLLSGFDALSNPRIYIRFQPGHRSSTHSIGPGINIPRMRSARMTARAQSNCLCSGALASVRICGVGESKRDALSHVHCHNQVFLPLASFSGIMAK